MLEKLFWLPVFMMVLLTFIVWIVMYRQRVAEMRARRIHPEKLKTTADAARLLESTGSENFANLFELPVLFYLLMVIIYVTDYVSWFFVTGGLLFVLLRAVHSYIHIGYNRVMHRFYAYSAGGFVLWLMWGWSFLLLMTA